MLTMEQIYNIRNMYEKEGKSKRAIVRETGHDFFTVKKFIEMEDFSPKAPIKTERKGKTSKYRQQVKQWLINDRHAPRKQRHTAKKVFDRLKEQAMKNNELFDVSDRAIRTLVAELRKELNVEETAYIPLSHPA